MNLDRKQKEICKKYGSSFTPIADNEMLAIALETIGQEPIFGRRIFKKGDNKISWYIYCGGNNGNDDFFKPVHAKHIKDIIPLVLPYLALEEGFSFILDNSGYEDVWKFYEEGN